MSVAWVGAGIALVGTLANADAQNNAEHDRRVANEAEQGNAADMLAYYRERDAQNAGLQAQANAIAGRVANAQIGLMDQQRRIADDYWKYNLETFRPLEKGMVADAQAYDTTERRESAAGLASADVAAQIDASRRAQARNSQRMGINPNSGNALAMNNQLSLADASARSSASNTARNNVETQGWARRMDAASLGRNLPSAQATAAGTAISAGNAATNAAYAPVNAANQATALTGAGLSTAYGMQSRANQMGLSSGSGGTNWGSQLTGLGTHLFNAYNNNQAATQTANLNYSNGVTAGGGDGLGAFITANNNWGNT